MSTAPGHTRGLACSLSDRGGCTKDSTRGGIDVQGDALFRRLIESVHEYAIFLLDPTGHVVTWNPGAKRIKGYEASEIIGQHFGRFYPAGTSAKKLDDELRDAVKLGHFEEENWRIRKDGTRFWANVVITPFYEGKELIGFIKVTRDLSDRLRHEEERAQFIANEARARAEVAARDAFLSVAAHELKTPITTTKAAAQLLRRSFRPREDLDPTQTRSLQLIEEQVEKLSQLVTRLLETVQIQAEKFVVLKERTDVVALVRSAIQRLDTPAKQMSLAAPDSLIAEIDPLRFDQVLTNLLSNAAKFGPPNEKIAVALDRDGSGLRLSVADRGPGVPKEYRERLFERFFQANPDRSGMGLGLFITKEIVEAHGGTIVAEFPPSGGTRFTVTLPG